MKTLTLKGKELRAIGYPESKVISIAMDVMHKNFKHTAHEEALQILKNVLSTPEEYLEDSVLSKIADVLVEKPKESAAEIALNAEKIEYNIFGSEQIEEGALKQMEIASRLPVAVAGALMPDAHQGYGLPIGGVLATENAVIPYAVGVDIGCRMCLSIFEIAGEELKQREASFQRELIAQTLFGAGKEFKEAREHEVIESKLFNEISVLKNLRQRAAKQLGSSGSGNHFVEFGIVEITEASVELNLPAGKYVALLSHSGSRGLGANIANHYTKVAMETCRLPNEAKHLAWLSLDSEAGQEYWNAMNLAGDYASACHHAIHEKIAKAIRVNPAVMVENHHNFAWKEIHNGKDVIVHRKGATPAGIGVLGIIPGSMTAPGFIVRGKGEAASLNSASHGAGRQMSRTKALNTITNHALKEMLNKHDVKLIGGGLDESPHAYKDIHAVMNSQKHLVDIIGTFYPKIVRMDG
jgi:tRNA-splicing ligase RtcB (3'-phosphate/5'-hydroxy nucleic acid ligase)